MTFFLDGQHIEKEWRHAGAEQYLISFVPEQQEASADAVPGMAEMALIEQREGMSTRFESHEGFDYFSLLVADARNENAPLCRVRAYLSKNRLTFLYQQPMPAVEKVIQRLLDGAALPENALAMFFSFLTGDDADKLTDIEEEISDFEDAVAEAVPEDSVQHISALRRRLLALKRYYEALFDLLEDLEENINELLSDRQLHALRLQTNRADRLSHTVQNLRDYVTQVRESYQAQIDIKMNKTMQFFTVVTTIFLPLTLLVGWYGMNLQMPEYDMPWLYPVVVVASVVLVVGLMAYFRRKKWF